MKIKSVIILNGLKTTTKKTMLLSITLLEALERLSTYGEI